MNKKETAEAIKVMTAYVDGADLEISKKPQDIWVPLLDPDGPHWDWSINEYRIKPKPREWSFYLDRYGAIVKILDENDLIMVLRGDKPDDSILVKVREVIPNEGK